MKLADVVLLLDDIAANYSEGYDQFNDICGTASKAASEIRRLRAENFDLRQQRDRLRGEVSDLRCRLDGVDIVDD